MLTTLITVFGTLGGVVLGVVLSKRYVAKQEKEKRNIAVIEEIYTLLTKVGTFITRYAEKDTDIDDIEPILSRIDTLINIYFPRLKSGFHELTESILLLTRRVQDEMSRGADAEFVWVNIQQPVKDYNAKMEELKSCSATKHLGLRMRSFAIAQDDKGKDAPNGNL